ncbi:outer membrane protein assembly factor BamA [Candidatus Pelagibacter sp.]|uniref:outer membrane protein assembly factor BamA n=1 Tax=Candidatus Pelagibacter sp. TaxID=2024849 RepID=UPI003F84EF32
MFKFIIIKIFFLFYFSIVNAEVIKKIEIEGNDRIPDQTIVMFSKVKVNDDINQNDVNKILKEIYDTNYFNNVVVDFNNQILKITVDEFPIIQNLQYEGIKAQKIRDAILENLSLKDRSSYNEILLKEDKKKIDNNLKKLGYYFSSTDVFVEELENNLVNVTYVVDLGEKAKIKKITFNGDKVFKDRKLKGIIISEEYKFWKFISGKKFLNEDMISFDERLLQNFYNNKGYYNAEINSSFAKLVGENEFELIYNINANKKIYFNEFKLNLPEDFDPNNFSSLQLRFDELKGQPYSINLIEKILEEVDKITLNEQYISIKASVDEDIIDDKINLTFNIEDGEKFIVERINIFGNNITRENVIRNQLEVDEGDPYNEILTNKSVNNIQSLNFFKTVNQKIVDGSNDNSKVINISVEEKPTGEITASAGVGTSGTSIGFGVRENNYLGRGIALDSNISLGSDTIKGLFSVSNPNFRNSDKAVYASAEASETDKLKASGYKTSKTGFELGTNFEYYDDVRIGLGTSSYLEKIKTSTKASAKMKKQKGDYFDTFANFSFDYDKRNQKFQTSDGFRSTYKTSVPLVSETNTLTNTYTYKYFTELYDDNISSFSIYMKAASSIKDKDIKLSERLFAPSNRLRGFEFGKVGPKDGNDYIGGNYVSTVNFTSTLPFILENAQNTDFLVFFDAANIWGVDYDSSLSDKSDDIRSAVGIGVDWFTPIGPLNFSLASPISKSNTDKTETFRFNLGTTF